MPIPSVSVVVPNYNHANYLSQCLKAILDQSVKPQEIIIIDDASTDNSVEVISKFAKQDSSVKLILNEKNLGTELTCVKGLEFATGDYIIFAGADDYLLPGFFEQSLRLLAKYPEAGICSALCRRINGNGDYIDTVPETPYVANTPCYISPEKMRFNMLNTNTWEVMVSTVLYNRQLLNKAKAYSLDAGKYIDVFSATLMALNYGACFIPKELGVFRVLSDSCSAKARDEPKVFLEYVKPMWTLMQTTYADKFPPEIRKVFKRRDLYTYGAMSLSKLDESQGKFLEDLAISFDEPTFLDRMFFFGTRLLGKAQIWITKGYLFLRLRRIDLGILIRVFHRCKRRQLKPSDRPQ